MGDSMSARGAIIEKLTVTRHEVMQAKDYILKNFSGDTQGLHDRFIGDLKINVPQEIVLHDSVALEPQVEQAAKYIGWKLAFGEAIWGLINQNIIIQHHNHLITLRIHLKWTTVVQGRGGSSGGLTFDEYEVFVPQEIRLAPSIDAGGPFPLFDSDLYILDINIPNLHEDIEESLRMAIECFRHDLFLPCLAMLARASEGAWIELGSSLLRYSIDSNAIGEKESDKFNEMLLSPYTSIMERMDRISQLYKKKEIFQKVYATSKSPKYLMQVLNWSTVLREYRNAIHYEKESTSQITYDKVSTLLLGAGPFLKVLYDIRSSVESTT